MKSKWLLILGLGWFVGVGSGWGQWRLTQPDQPSELRLDRSLPGVFHSGSNLNGRWVVTKKSERRQWTDTETFFKAEGVSVFYSHMDLGAGMGAPTPFADEWQNPENRQHVEFFFGEFVEPTTLGLDFDGIRRVFVQLPNLFSAQGLTFLVENTTGQTVKGLRLRMDVFVKEDASVDLPKLEMQISRDDRVYETFFSWMPKAVGGEWERETLEAEVAEEIPDQGRVFIRIWTGTGTGPKYARLGWSRIELTALSEEPVHAGKRVAAEEVAERRVGVSAADPSPEATPEPAPTETVAQVDHTHVMESVPDEVVPAPTQVRVPLVTASATAQGQSRLKWVLIGGGVVGLALLAGCGIALIRLGKKNQPEEI